MASDEYRFSVPVVDGDIDEMVDIYRSVLISGPPQYHMPTLRALTRDTLNHYSRNKQLQCLDKVIGCLRDALETFSSNSHHVPVQYELAKLLIARFLDLRVDDDFEKAKEILDVIAPLSNQIGDPDKYQIQTLTSALELSRSIILSTPDDWKGPVDRCRSFLDNCPSYGDPLHPVITELLDSHTERVSKLFGSPRSTRTSHLEADFPSSARRRLSDESGGSDVSTISPLAVVEEESRRLRDLLSTSLRVPGTERQKKCLNSLVRCYGTMFSLTQDVTAIEEAIKYRRMFLVTTHPSDPSLSYHRSSFANFLHFAFSHDTKRIEYLDEEVTLHREVLAVENARPIHFVTIRWLIRALSILWLRYRHRPDLDEIMDLFESGISEDTYATVPSRFELACDWAYAARISVHRSLPNAYKHAMSLMQSSLVFVPTLTTQHDRLVEKRDLYEKTPLNIASYHIRVGQLERAIEDLEQGRTLLWSQMHGLRTPVDRLLEAYPKLAEEFSGINRKLESLTTSASSNRNVGMGDDASNDKSIGQLSVLRKEYFELNTKRDALISHIRNQLGIKDFLLPLPFDTLRSAASHGTVIVINHCKWRSDIIIVRHNSLPSLITTPYYFFGRMNELKDKLLGARQRCGPNPQQYVDTLVSVQKDLYELIGQPVIKRLDELGIPEQSRVWWCPTSVLGYLPLHAMGPIPSNREDPCYFQDLYISSYTPTLSALLTSRASRESASQSSDQRPVAWSDGKIIRNLDLQATSLGQGNAALATALDGLQRHQFVFIGNNGELRPQRPFDACIRFHNGEESKDVTLLDFVRSQHPAGELALLTGSLTAELTEGSLPDEALQLSAAVQYSGYRSVIGTLWGADEPVDYGQDLAKAILSSMLTEEGGGEPYYERSARSLRDAVQQMRRRLKLSSVQWVKYVHFGA